MIIKLNSTYHSRVMKYLKKEPEYNLFIIGDIERYGYGNNFLNIWADIDELGEIKAILLKYFEFMMFYSDGEYDVEGFYNLLRNTNYEEISGKICAVDALAKRLGLNNLKVVDFCKLQTKKFLIDNNCNAKVKRIRLGNLKKTVKLYDLIDEFHSTTLENLKNGLRTGRGYCIEINKQVVSMAKSTSENRTHAMIIGVGTHSKYRARGLATKCLIKLCSELLRENKIPCLFYDNEEAGKIYKKLGFENIGKWGIYSK
ncbi:GNAT family N-acetyltransferase [Clostridioides difficile]|nr:GNAT family N-acetyltransferase [Clostridioides difficile]EGT4666730.1 GNAT family N-acetyltransferase [Clostridioides difficile]